MSDWARFRQKVRNTRFPSPSAVARVAGDSPYGRASAGAGSPMTAKELPHLMSLVQRALSPVRILGAAVVVAVLVVAAALVVAPSSHRHDLAVSDDIVAPDTIESHRPVPAAAS